MREGDLVLARCSIWAYRLLSQSVLFIIQSKSL